MGDDASALDGIRPGTCLRDPVDDCGLGRGAVAAALGLNRSSLYRLLRGDLSITPRIAVGLENIGIGKAEMWMRLQAKHDLAIERRRQAAA